jgi:hypothetical protein
MWKHKLCQKVIQGSSYSTDFSTFLVLNIQVTENYDLRNEIGDKILQELIFFIVMKMSNYSVYKPTIIKRNFISARKVQL